MMLPDDTINKIHGSVIDFAGQTENHQELNGTTAFRAKNCQLEVPARTDNNKTPAQGGAGVLMPIGSFLPMQTD
ncbi:hypothetical protein [Kordiimonas sp.]|uniref:hypothetical protein n=1 Tax=Kordiimonas sp. TaxID=1970157 RepID=UPI003A920960